ncbi:AAA family ATPase [Acinetobacter sp. CFCC 10889]|uniref:AAA family ATPase n=1 Tax=Acinetobacter sp. CFCC 10889 TaxID=1775557 RepID=UPI000DD02B04|nr:ATP-binding protein [Acinetobacter sp. CFCC 10889]
MNKYIDQPFANDVQQGEVESFAEIRPLAKLWALRFLVELGGSKEFISDNCFSHQWIAKHLGFSDGLCTDQFNEQLAHQELNQLYQNIEQQHLRKPFQFSAELQFNLKLLQQLLDLNDVEILILAFVVLLNSEQLLDDIADTIGELTASKTLRALAVVLKVPYDDIRQALSVQGRLHRSGLISVQQHYRNYLRGKLSLVSNQLVDKLLVKANDVMDLFSGTINKSETTELTLQDYPYLDKDLSLLLAYLKQVKNNKQKGVNIFLYGSSGTGKTELCKVIAEQLNVQLFEISYEDADGDAISATGRLCAYRAAQCIFDSQSALLMFDEIEDVFNDTENGMGMKSTAQSRKAWVNRILEQNRTPTIWVSNSDQLDPAFIRRFDMVLEIKVPPKKQRMNFIAKQCAEDIDPMYQEAFANVEQLSPAILNRSYKVAKMAKMENEDLAVQGSMRKLISNTLKAQGFQAVKLQDSNALPKFYDLDYINTSADLKQIAVGIQQHGFGRLCLYGASGTGKTAFARWLAEYLDQPLLVKRGSDLISPWVGETEQNLAKAFSDAEEQQAVLLLDEVDGLLQDRRQATRSWEISQVNEFLVQMESFNGIVVATTNRFEELDQAALRRFDFKMHFDFLSYQQRLALLENICLQLNLEMNEAQVQNQLHSLNKLSAGDFAVIARQACFKPFEHVNAVLQHLEEEMSVKYKISGKMGF